MFCSCCLFCVCVLLCGACVVGGLVVVACSWGFGLCVVVFGFGVECCSCCFVVV